MKTQRIAEILKSGVVDTDVHRSGMGAHQARQQNVAFIALNDGSCASNIQVGGRSGEDRRSSSAPVTTGACLRMWTDDSSESLGAGQGVEVQAASITLYGAADPETYPLQKGVIRSNSCATSPTCVRAPIRSAPCCASATPWPVPSTTTSTATDSTTSTRRSCHGLGLRGRRRHVQRDDARSETTFRKPGRARWTMRRTSSASRATSPCRASSKASWVRPLGRICTFGPTFRAENSNTPRHLSEFWMIEARWPSTSWRTTWSWPRTSSSRSSATPWSTAPRTWRS